MFINLSDLNLAYPSDHQDALVSFAVGGDVEVTGFISWDDGVHSLPVLSVDLIPVYGLNPDRFHIDRVLLHTTLVLQTPQTHGQKTCSAVQNPFVLRFASLWLATVRFDLSKVFL